MACTCLVLHLGQIGANLQTRNLRSTNLVMAGQSITMAYTAIGARKAGWLW